MLDQLIHKEVRYHIQGKDLSFSLSMGLFSSNDIDTGTKLFLSHLVRELDVTKYHTLLDAGCGAGIIGITMKMLYPHLKVTSTDRDALALAFTKHNAAKNHLSLEVRAGLDSLQLASAAKGPFLDPSHHSLQASLQQFDLILTNIPAKAGKPVLLRFLTNGLAQLTRHGVFGFVIVDTLKETAARLCTEAGADIIYRYDGPRHTIYLIQKRTDHGYQAQTGFPDVYRRTHTKFNLKTNSYSLDTVYDLPGFDTLPYDVELTRKVLDTARPSTVTIWNPEQGHHAAALITRLQADTAQSDTPILRHIQLAGRDLLALCTAQHNIAQLSPVTGVSTFHLPGIAELSAAQEPLNLHPADLMIVSPDPIPRVPFYDQLVQAVASKTDNLARELIITAKSSSIAPFERGLPGYRRVAAKKGKGFRAIHFHRLY